MAVPGRLGLDLELDGIPEPSRSAGTRWIRPCNLRQSAAIEHSGRSSGRSCMKHRMFELGQRLAVAHREALQVWHGIATAGEAEVHLAGIADEADVERLAVERAEHWV